MHWSIIICTLNRAADLKANLPKLAKLNYLKGKYEVLVVDNGSEDGTAEIVKEAARQNDAIVLIMEERRGLSFARNRGIEIAQGELIAFIDDDAWPEDDWLIELEKGFAEPRVACVGGRVLPVFRSGMGWPAWLPGRFKGFFTVVDYAHRRYLHYPDFPAGTNIAFRKSALREIGVFNTSIGRIGVSLLSMEEVDLCLRLEHSGHHIIYLPEAVVHHTVAENRLSREWIRERAHWQGTSAAIIEQQFFSTGSRVLKSLKYVLYVAAGMVGEVIGRLTSNERLGIFCSCQTKLCLAWLQRAWRMP
jgi:glycosyltransferase involved in cell wall biosynthesis